MFTVKKDFTAYRGDLNFKILYGVKVGDSSINLADVVENVSKVFKQKYLVNPKIEQPQ